MKIEYNKHEVELIVKLHFWQTYEGIAHQKFGDDKKLCKLDENGNAVIESESIYDGVTNNVEIKEDE